jgi:hypothetical protein
VQIALAINGCQIIRSFYCKPVRAPLLASLSIARQQHQRHGHRPGTLGSVEPYPREEPSKKGRCSGGLKDSFAIHLWARQRHGADYFRRGCCWAHTISTSPSRTPERRVVFHNHSGVKRGVWHAMAGVLELFFTFG